MSHEKDQISKFYNDYIIINFNDPDEVKSKDKVLKKQEYKVRKGEALEKAMSNFVKQKTFSRSKKLNVTLTNSGISTENGLTENNVAFGLRVEDKELSLNNQFSSPLKS